MPVKAKIDEDLPASIAEMFRDAGHDAMTVGEQGFNGYSDDRLWQEIQHERRVLITADIAVADPRAHPPGTHAGIVLFRLDDESREAYLALARLLLAWPDIENLHGAITVVTPTRIRSRR